MKTSMRISLLIIVLLFQVQVHAEIRALFHPYDETFVEINRWISEAQGTIDIAMYNMDAKTDNDVIRHLASPEIQNRLARKNLQIRLIFNGNPKKSAEKLKAFEELGMDVRYMDQAKTLHHKFALIDAGTAAARLVTGSANWSMFSRLNYSENVLFLEHEPRTTLAFQREFESLWQVADDYNPDSKSKSAKTVEVNRDDEGLSAHFNTENFKLVDGRFVDDHSQEGFVLTRTLVSAIEDARESILVATTRIKLRPVYEALLKAAQRGVKVQIVVSMDEYETKKFRSGKTVPSCPDLYDADCSAGNNYTVFLEREDFPAHENIDVRVKFFNMNLGAHLSHQMHSKYMIVDRTLVLSGSFNWSYSAEYNHIENLLVMDGASHPEVARAFVNDFERLYELNRKSYSELQARFEKVLDSIEKVDCSFEPLSVTFQEIDQLFSTADERGKSFKDVCLAK